MSEFAEVPMPLAPLVFGIVGHRDPRPEDDQTLRAALRTVFRGFHEAYPHTPQLLLSALAAGADQMAVEVALECGVTVWAPLPFPAEVYAQTSSFDSPDCPAAKQMLCWVSDKSVESFVAPLPESGDPISVAAWEAKANDQAQRRTCYANAGGYIVRHSDVLIALWDEDTDPRDAQNVRKPSGTAELVALKLDGTAPALYPWKLPLGFRADRGPVCVIHTPRAGRPTAKESIVATVRLPGEREIQPASLLWRRTSAWTRFGARVASWIGVAAHRQRREHAHTDMVVVAESAAAVDVPTPEIRQFRTACATVDEFNADVRAQLAANPSLRLDATWKKLLPSSQTMDGMKPALQRAARLRDISGALANRLGARMNRWEWLLFACACVAVVSFHSYSEPFFGHPLFLLWLSIVTIAAAFLIVGVVWWQRLDERRLDYRALAEALRVRCYWALAGLKDSVADSYLGQLRGEMAWARRAVRSVCPPSHLWSEEFTGLSASDRAARIETVRTQWAVEQQSFYERKGHENHRMARCYRIAGISLAIFGWVLAMVLFFVRQGNSARGEAAVDSWDQHAWVSCLSGIFLIAAGFAFVICERRFHEELSKQYERMAVVFADANRELSLACQAGDLARAQDTIRALGNEAIAEHAQWLILRRERPFELNIA